MNRLAAIFALALLAGCGLKPSGVTVSAASNPGEWGTGYSGAVGVTFRGLRVAPGSAWPDRRPIARIDIAAENEREFDPKRNPRGYHGVFHVGLDARDRDYPEQFARRLKPWWGERVKFAKEQGAQLVWLLDGEGRQYPQPVTYLGNWWTAAPPEMTPDLRRWMVAECKRNGLGFGVTVRHTAPLQLAHGNVDQVPVADPATAIVANLQAIRWGLGPELVDTFRFAYWDTNNEPNAWATGKGPLPLPADDVRKVVEAVPGVLLMTEWGTLARVDPAGRRRPEYGDPGYLDVPRVAAWRDANFPAHPLAMDKAPGAFEIVMPPHSDWAPTPEDEARLAAEFRAGHVPVFTATWDHPHNEWMLRAWRAAQAD